MSTPAHRPAVRVAVCGAGNVAGALMQILQKKADFLAKTNCPITVTKVLVRDTTKPRPFVLPEGAEFVTDFRTIVEDKEVELVVELIGGTTDAKEIVLRSLRAGKHVVTANKALLASCMAEIEAELLASGGACQFGYEAAVCGGIPIIQTLVHGLAGDDVVQLAGIMNGTTNFMLSAMESEGASYDEILRVAQEKGFAEADPTADVEGHDARAKLCILTRLATGARIAQEDIPCVGISKITSDDMSYAKASNSAIKLLGVCRVEGDELEVFVHPCFIKNPNMIARTSGATNIVEITSSSLGKSYLIGEGAGGLPTANSVMSDIVAVLRGSTAPPFPPLNTSFRLQRNFSARFYVRMNVRDCKGIVAVAGAVCLRCDISIFAVLQTPIVDPSDLPFVITTEVCTVAQVEAFCAEIEKEEWCLRAPFFMPICRNDGWGRGPASGPSR